MADRYPSYNVLDKRNSMSWNGKTREIVDQRLKLIMRKGIVTETQLATLQKVVDIIVPQPEGRTPVNTAAILLERIARDQGDGFRRSGMPHFAKAWKIGLDALDAEARACHGAEFAKLADTDIQTLLDCISNGRTKTDWNILPAHLFWSTRLLPDIVAAYYSHPSAWSAMGFGGPASPRGYVRLEANRRDPWEAAESVPETLPKDPNAAEDD